MVEKIRMFLAICLEGSTLKAAEALHVSQPAISQGIKELERQLEVKLFQRQGRKLILSPQGESFIPYAQGYLKSHDEAMLAFKKPNLSLKIGSSMTIGSTLLPELIQGFEKASGIECRLHVNNARKIKEMLENNQLDLALLEGVITSEDYLYYPLGEFSLRFVASPDYLAERDTTKGWREYDFLVRESGSSYRQQFNDFCLKNQILKEPKWECSTNEIIKQAALNHQGVALLPTELIALELSKGQLVELPIKQVEISETYGIALNKLRMEESGIQGFIAFTLGKEGDSQ